MKNSFKHSGTLGDIVYSLPVVKHLGGGDFYLHLHQIDWIGQHYYGAKPSSFHQGRMTMKDFEFMERFFRAQEYITKFEPLDPKTTEITHNLDNFRRPFVGHPGNYVDIYADVFGLGDSVTKYNLRHTPWLTVPSKKTVEGRKVMINRTGRWVATGINPMWNTWKEQGVDNLAFFVGLPQEYEEFKKVIGWDIPFQPVKDMFEMAEYVAGSEVFIGNQSVAFSIAVGLGHQDVWCEARRDLPIERNECYFPEQQGIHYF